MMMLQRSNGSKRVLLGIVQQQQQRLLSSQRTIFTTPLLLSSLIPNVDRRWNSSFSSSSSSSSSKQPRGIQLSQQVAAVTTAAGTDNDSKKPLANVRKQLWEFYFSTGRGANALFEAIDIDENSLLEPGELKSFMIEVLSYEHKGTIVHVDPRDIMPYAWNILEKREAANQQYDIRSFKKWLVAATKMSADTKNSRLMEYLQSNPNVGENSYVSDGEDDDEPSFSWNEESMSQSLRRMQYAVRGEVVMKADQLAAQGKEILYTNIGNPHQVGQSPITYYRQVLALCDLPAECGVDHPNVYDMFPKDVVARAREYREDIGPSGTGAYTHSQGS
jgi:hypothetical protein